MARQIYKGRVRARRFKTKSVPRDSMYQIANRVVKANMTGDMMYKDTSQAPVSVSYDVPYSQCLCEIAQGTGSQQRVGDRIGITSVEFNAQLIHSVSSTNTAMMGIALVLAKTEVDPTWGSIYRNVSNDNVLGMRLPQNRGEYIVLKRWYIDLGHAYGSDKGTKIITYRKTFKKPLQCNYNGALSTNYRYNTLYIVATGNQLNAAAPPQMLYSARVNYTP